MAQAPRLLIDSGPSTEGHVRMITAQIQYPPFESGIHLYAPSAGIVSAHILSGRDEP